MNIYKYIFYRTYTWQLKKWGAEDVPEYKAMFIVSIFASLNVLTIVLLLRKLGLINVDVQHLPKVVQLFLLFMVTIILYFSFVYHDKYKIIEENYKMETLKQRNINSVLVLLYMIASFYVYVFI